MEGGFSKASLQRMLQDVTLMTENEFGEYEIDEEI
jgi:hypothetical protein